MSTMEMTWLGTASIRLRAEGTTILFDPFLELPGGEHANSVSDFSDADAIFITHGHLDHLLSVPVILQSSSPTVYGTGCVVRLLHEEAGPLQNIRTIKPGDCIQIGPFMVNAYQGCHVRFDPKLVLHTLSPRNLSGRFDQAMEVYRLNRQYTENGETVFYDLHCRELHLQVMGSLALREDVTYPTGADILFLPYQGNSKLEQLADAVIQRLQPKGIVLTHFDNAFPPISQSVNTDGFVRLMQTRYPDKRYSIPTFGEAVQLAEM